MVATGRVNGMTDWAPLQTRATCLLGHLVAPQHPVSSCVVSALRGLEECTRGTIEAP